MRREVTIIVACMLSACLPMWSTDTGTGDLPMAKPDGYKDMLEGTSLGTTSEVVVTTEPAAEPSGSSTAGLSTSLLTTSLADTWGPSIDTTASIAEATSDDATSAIDGMTSAAATTEDTPDALCGDGINGPGEQCDDGNSIFDDGCASCRFAGLLFVTSKAYVGGELGGLQGAHQICQAHATAAGLSGMYLAVLSVDGQTPPVLLKPRNLLDVTGELVDESTSFSHIWQGSLYNAPRRTEYGAAVSSRVWTGSVLDEQDDPQALYSGDCQGWTETQARGGYGLSDGDVWSRWWAHAYFLLLGETLEDCAHCCSRAYRLYCAQVP